MKAGVFTQAAQLPDSLKIEKLLNGTHAVSAADNIQTLTVVDGEDEQAVERTEYSYTAYSATVELSGYEDAVAALVGLKYSYADEFALMRKGITDSANEEYTAYVAYVEQCKAYAREYYGITAEGGDPDGTV